VADPAVFLDRDGTLIADVGYATRPEQIRILGGVARALADLAAAGYRLIVVTNQSGIARGYATEADLERFHQALDEQFHLLGAAVDAYYACPHHPDPGTTRRPDLAVDCNCRKPKPGLILRAAEDFGIDLSASWTVGDTWRDIAAGQAAGTRTIKVPTDPAHDLPRPPDVDPPTAEAKDLAEAARFILEGLPEPADDDEAGEAPSDEITDAPAEPLAAAPTTAEGVAAVSFHAEVSSRALTAGAEPARETPTPPNEAPYPPPVPEPPSSTPPLVSGEAMAKLPAERAAGVSSSAHPAPRENQDARAPDDAEPAPEPSQCARCGAAIAEADIAAGAAARRNDFLLCPECLARQPREAEATHGPAGDDVLQSILLELQRLRRDRRASTFSALSILAYVVQAAALFFGFGLALLGDERDLYIDIAVLLQLLVLALLLFERRS